MDGYAVYSFEDMLDDWGKWFFRLFEVFWAEGGAEIGWRYCDFGLVGSRVYDDLEEEACPK